MNELELFSAALDLERPDERSAYLDRSCGDNVGLRQRVEALLRSYAGVGRFMATPVPGPGITAEHLAPPEQCGTVIGPYQLLDQIGEGGMGTVYRAEQTEPVRRKVALKIIKAGMDSKSVIARFEAERQALAIMDHPNITRVFDGGTTPSGRPYFVMELVKGVPITEFCDRNRLTARQRLELFLPVCQALQHAHQKGIIHRDLKPSNVLVSGQEATPAVKVIDFGVAKALGEELTDKTLFTGGAQMIGTPLYMSPEQAGVSGLDVDTRSDIYSLGVLLYELLTGTTPFTHERFKKAAYEEIRAIIREEEPPRPSTRLRDSGEELVSIAARRHTEPVRLAKVMQGDLDWIVMKCLEKDRNRRYDTANGLAMDVRRYLQDQPVLARPPSTCYRLAKFVHRNKGRVALAGGALVLLLVLAIGVPVNALLRHERDAVLGSLERAERAEAETRGVLHELQSAQQEIKIRSHLNQARAFRHSGKVGQRLKCLEELAQAARLNPSAELRRELRNEAIACLALADLRPYKILEGWPLARKPVFDAMFERYVCPDDQGNVTVRHAGDDREILHIPNRGAAVHNYFFSSDSRLLAVNYGEKVVTEGTVWDLARGTLILSQAGGVACFTPGNRQAVTWVFQGGEVRLYELSSGQEQKHFAVGPGWHGMALHPDGRRLAVSQPGDVQIWDVQTGTIHQSLWALSSPGGRVAWSPDGRFLAAVGEPASLIRVWEVNSGRLQAELPRISTVISALAFNPSGDLLVTAGWDETYRFWDPLTGRQLLAMDGTGEQATFSPDGKLLGYFRSGNKIELLEVVSAAAEYRTLAGPAGSGDAGLPDFSRDQRLLSHGCLDGVRVWDWVQRREVAFLPGRSSDAVFSPTDSTLLTCGTDGLLCWPITSVAPATAGGKGQPTRLRFGPPSYLAATGKLSSPSVSRDGTTLAVMDSDRGRGLIVDLQKGSEIARLADHRAGFQIALSPDGRWAATGSKRTAGTGVTKVWDVRAGTTAKDLPLEVIAGDAVVAFSGDGNWLVTGTPDEFRFWKTGSWEPAHAIARDHGGTIAGALACSPDGRMVAIARSPTRVQLHDPSTAEEFASLVTPDPQHIHSLRFSPDGSLLAAARENEVVTIWDLRQIRRQLAAIGLDWDLPPYPPAPARPLLRDDGTVARPTVAATVIQDAAELRCLRGPGVPIACIALGPGGRTVLVGSASDSLSLWDLETGEEVCQLVGHRGPVVSAVISADGRRAVSCSYDRTLRLWDLEAGKELRVFEGHNAAIEAVAASPDGRRALSASQDGTVRLWDLDGGGELRRFEGKGGLVHSVAFSPNNAWALSGSADGIMRLWDLETGRELRRFPGGGGSWVDGVAFSPKGDTAYSAGGAKFTLRAWDPHDGLELRRFVGHTDYAQCLTVSPDGRYLLSGARDHTVRLWDAATGEELHCFRGHTKVVASVAFLPDGRRALSASNDGTMRLWDLSAHLPPEVKGND